MSEPLGLHDPGGPDHAGHRPAVTVFITHAGDVGVFGCTVDLDGAEGRELLGRQLHYLGDRVTEGAVMDSSELNAHMAKLFVEVSEAKSGPFGPLGTPQ